MSVAEAQSRISSREFAEWMAFYRLEPFGEERADLRMAILAAVIANANRDPKQRKQPYEPKDFMPQFDQPQDTETEPWEQQLALAHMITAAQGPRPQR